MKKVLLTESEYRNVCEILNEAKADATNAYVIRQEYNEFKKCWYPIIFYWNWDVKMPSLTKRYCYLATDDGRGFYHGELDMGQSYTTVSKKGTDKCEDEHIEKILNSFFEECRDDGYEPIRVEKLDLYSPR